MSWRPLCTAGLLLCAAQGASGQEERWYCGRLEGEACLSAREVIAPLGSATDTRFELELVVKAPRAVVFREAQRCVESALGRLREFRYETCEAGRVVTLRGSVRDQRVRALLVQDGVERRLSLELEPEAPLVGRVGERLQFLQLQAPGDSVEYSALELSSGALSLRVTKARLIALLPKGRRVVEVSSDGSPLRAVLDEEGDFHSLRYSIAGLCMQVVRCDGPVSLEGAVLPRTATVHAEGVPRFQERNAYELPLPLQRLAAEDAFQTLEGETLFVRSTSRPTAPDDLESSREPSAGIEADAPELLAWLKGLEGVGGARSFSSRLASLRTFPAPPGHPRAGRGGRPSDTPGR